MEGEQSAEAQRKAQEFLEGQQLYFRSLKAHRDELRRYKLSEGEHRAAIELLRELPATTKRDIMVPMGPKAFMPGQLVHTNEVLVLLGENYFVERSAMQAEGIIARRLEVIRGLVDATEKKAKDLAARADLSGQAKEAMQGGGGRGGGGGAGDQQTAPSLQKEGTSAKPPRSVPIQEVDGENDEDDDEDENEDDDEGKGAEFWAAAGFVGGWGDNPRSSDEDEDESDEGEEQIPCAGSGPRRGTLDQDEEWDDSQPVFEIVEGEDGAQGELVEHASQIAFEQSKSYPF